MTALVRHTSRTILLFVTSSSAVALGQCSGEPPQGSYAVSAANTTIYYQLDSSLITISPGPSSPSVTTQIQAAFAAWSQANQTNGSGTTFVQTTAGQTPSVIVVASQEAVSGYESQTQVNGSSVVAPGNPATITLYPQATLSGTNTSAFQATATGYTSAYQQVMLHEIGHVMGFADYTTAVPAPPFSSTASVMVPFSGVNDIGNLYPKSAPTSCDQQTVAAYQKAIAPGGGSGGGNAPPPRSAPPSNPGNPEPNPDPPNSGDGM